MTSARHRSYILHPPAPPDFYQKKTLHTTNTSKIVKTKSLNKSVKLKVHALKQECANVYLNGPNCTKKNVAGQPENLVPSKTAVVIASCILKKNFPINLHVTSKYCLFEDLR